MPHPRVSTAAPASQVQMNIKAILDEYVRSNGPLGYREVYTYANQNTETTITLYGHTALLHAYARYEGVHGIWEITLSDGYGNLVRKSGLAEIQAHRVSRICGRPWRVAKGD